MRNIFKFLKPHMKFVILAPLFMLLEVACELQQPKLMSKIVDIGIANDDLDYVIRTGGIMILLSLFGTVGGVGCAYFAAKASSYFGTDIRSAMFEKIQRFSFVNIDKFQTSSLITRLTNDVTQIQQIVLMGLKMLVRSPLLFVGGIIMVVSINAELAKILIVAIPILIIAIIIILRFGFPLFLEVQKKVDNVNLVMRENLAGVRVIKAFVRSDYEKERFSISSEELKDKSIKAFAIMSSVMPIMMLIMNGTTIAVLWLGGIKASQGGIETGEIMAFITYLIQILMSLMMAAMVLMGISRGKASIDRANEILQADIDIVSPDEPTKEKINSGGIEFNNVTFSYPESTGDPVLENVNLKIKAGETVGILGQTGAGKTSLVNLIPRLYNITKGEILIDGIDIRTMNLDDLRNQIGVTLQQAILFSGTIRENIKWGKKDATEEEIQQALRISQSHEFIEKLPLKLETKLGQMGVNLSGGQKQRLSIARSIIKKPKIIIFDDSTSAVDVATEANIQNGLKNEMPECTKIIIAQRISSVINADKIIVIHSGEISGVGSHNELLQNNEIYRDIYNSQQRNEGVLMHE